MMSDTGKTERRVRVRFAPSPTGPLHIGGLRTALYNYLYAKKHDGDFLLRIEDTDRTRFVEGAEAYIRQAFSWCGIRFDEGTEEGGDYGPYRQSERRSIYLDYTRLLLEKGHAYYAFDTPEELEAMRTRLQAEGASSQQYDASTRSLMKNSLTLTPQETSDWLGSGKPYVVRFLVQPGETLVINDLIRGRVEVDTTALDDKVLMKADGMPTYHLANIVDDHLMGITHVIRGEEWLPSAPLHALLYEAFGWDHPEFAHLPLLLKPEGSGKLSKRDGDRLGFPVFPLQWKDPASGELSAGYREEGYLPQAFLNMLAMLGWNPGTEQEIFTLEELVEVFSLDRVSKSGARFDPAKARWFNHQYLLAADPAEILGIYLDILRKEGVETTEEIAMAVLGLVKERAELLPELWDQSSFFFVPPDEYEEKTARKRWKEGTGSLLLEWSVAMSDTTWERDTLHDETMAFLGRRETGAGQLMNPLRLALVGGAKGPDLFAITSILGRDETGRRISAAIRILDAKMQG